MSEKNTWSIRNPDNGIAIMPPNTKHHRTQPMTDEEMETMYRAIQRDLVMAGQPLSGNSMAMASRSKTRTQ